MKKNNSKLNNRPTKGFRSKWEYIVSLALKQYKARTRYEPFKIPYVLRKHYLPDWEVRLKNGYTFYIEAKGRFTPEDRRKIEAVLDYNPTLDLRLVFLSDNKLGRGKLRYSDWCEMRKIPYAIGHVPKEWFE